MGNPIPTQVRSVDPYSSYNSNVVNKLTRIISDGNNTLLMPSPITIEIVNNTTARALAGKAIMDDVLIEIENINIDMTDIDYYVDGSGGVWNETGNYYIVLHYEYAKISPPPEASVKIIKPSQRASVYNPGTHLFLGCISVSAPGGVEQLDEVFNYDPENPEVGRPTAGGGGAGTSVVYSEIGSGSYVATSDDDTVVANTASGNATVTLPLAATSDRVIRIMKLSSDANTVTVQRQGSDTIEGNTTVTLANQFDVVSLAPYAAANLWIEV